MKDLICLEEFLAPAFRFRRALEKQPAANYESNLCFRPTELSGTPGEGLVRLVIGNVITSTVFDAPVLRARNIGITSWITSWDRQGRPWRITNDKVKSLVGERWPAVEFRLKVEEVFDIEIPPPVISRVFRLQKPRKSEEHPEAVGRDPTREERGTN